MIKAPDTTEQHDFEEVEPQMFGEVKMQDDGHMRLNAGCDRWIASDLMVKAYR